MRIHQKVMHNRQTSLRGSSQFLIGESNCSQNIYLIGHWCPHEHQYMQKFACNQSKAGKTLMLDLDRLTCPLFRAP